MTNQCPSALSEFTSYQSSSNPRKVVFCCIFVLFIILSWIVYLTKRGHFLERIKTIRTRMWLGYPKHVDEIHTAIFQYNSEKVETLLTHRKSILDSKTENGDTCLILAIKTKNYEMVKTLIDAGCDRKVCDNAGKSPLFYAMRSKNAQILELVNGNNIDSTITKGIFHAELDSFNKRIEHRVSKNVYNIRRVSKGGIDKNLFLHIHRPTKVTLYSK